MPDLTVIEGGGQRRDWDRDQAEQLFQQFAVALVRGLSGGDVHPTTDRFFKFLEHMQDTRLPVGPVIDAALRDLGKLAFDDAVHRTERQIDETEVRLAAWKVTVEHMTDDGLTKARLSTRKREMRSAIDQMVLSRETMAREHGWSYVGNLTKHLGRGPGRHK